MGVVIPFDLRLLILSALSFDPMYAPLIPDARLLGMLGERAVLAGVPASQGRFSADVLGHFGAPYQGDLLAALSHPAMLDLLVRGATTPEGADPDEDVDWVGVGNCHKILTEMGPDAVLRACRSAPDRQVVGSLAEAVCKRVGSEYSVSLDSVSVLIGEVYGRHSQLFMGVLDLVEKHVLVPDRRRGFPSTAIQQWMTDGMTRFLDVIGDHQQRCSMDVDPVYRWVVDNLLFFSRNNPVNENPMHGFHKEFRMNDVGKQTSLTDIVIHRLQSAGNFDDVLHWIGRRIEGQSRKGTVISAVTGGSSMGGERLDVVSVSWIDFLHLSADIMRIATRDPSHRHYLTQDLHRAFLDVVNRFLGSHPPGWKDRVSQNPAGKQYVGSWDRLGMDDLCVRYADFLSCRMVRAGVSSADVAPGSSGNANALPQSDQVQGSPGAIRAIRPVATK